MCKDPDRTQVVTTTLIVTSQSENSRELLSSIRSQVVSVYTQVYVYQMRFVLQYARNKIHRVMRNLVTADKWKQMWMDIETTSQRIDQGVQHRVTTRTLDIWKAVDDIKTRDADLKSLQQTVLAAVQVSSPPSKRPFYNNIDILITARLVMKSSSCYRCPLPEMPSLILLRSSPQKHPV